MKSRHIYLGPYDDLPKESTNEESYKRDNSSSSKSPLGKHEISAKMQSSSTERLSGGGLYIEHSPSSVYLVQHTK